MYKRKFLHKSSRPYVSPSEHRNLHYLKNLKDTLEAHQTKAASILFRKNLIEHQNKMNYTTELSRIRGELSQTNLPYQTRLELLERKKRLEKLGAEIADKIN